MPERFELPSEEPVKPGYPDAVEKNSPEFIALREEKRLEMQSKNPKEKIDEGLLDFMAHIEFVSRGIKSDREQRKEKFRQQA